MLGAQGRGGEQGKVGELAALSVVLIACPDILVHTCACNLVDKSQCSRVKVAATECLGRHSQRRDGHKEGGHQRCHPLGLPCHNVWLGLNGAQRGRAPVAPSTGPPALAGRWCRANCVHGGGRGK